MVMTTINLSAYDYDGLRTCPFCASSANLTSDRRVACSHFVAAFEFGAWGRRICPPVSCDGYLFSESLHQFLAEDREVVCKCTPGTRRHPKIEAFYHPRPAFVADMRKALKIEQSLR